MIVSPILEIQAITHRWPKQRDTLFIRHLSIAAGERVFLRGPSGCGKSTLLNLIAGTLASHSGHISLTGHALELLSSRARDQLRADSIGVVFQQFNLLPFLNVIDNVTLPCRFSAKRRAAAVRNHGSTNQAALVLLASLGLGAQIASGQAVSELSVGQQQRVAVARALIGEPALVLADEPTSALDSDARDSFMQLLLAESTSSGAAVLFVSHDGGLAHHFDRALHWAELMPSSAQTAT